MFCKVIPTFLLFLLFLVFLLFPYFFFFFPSTLSTWDVVLAATILNVLIYNTYFILQMTSFFLLKFLFVCLFIRMSLILAILNLHQTNMLNLLLILLVIRFFGAIFSSNKIFLCLFCSHSYTICMMGLWPLGWQRKEISSIPIFSREWL